MALKKKTKRKIIVAAITVSIIAAVIISIIPIIGSQRQRIYNQISQVDIQNVENTYKPVSDEKILEGFSIAAQDSKSALLVSEETANVALFDKESRQLYFTALTPELAGESMPFSDLVKSRMMSQINIKYCDSKNNIEEINSYDMCVANKSFGIKNINNGVEISYLVGEVKKERLLPGALTEQRYNEITSKLSPADRTEIYKWYMKVDIESEEEEERQKLLEEYPQAKHGVIYVLRSGLADYILDENERILKAVGYTFEDKVKDEELFADLLAKEVPKVVKVVINYVIDGGDLVISIDKSKIKYPPEQIPLELTLMEYFMSAGTDEEGYMLVPDGCGSLIHFNNGKKSHPPFKGQIYGADLSTQPVMNTENVIPSVLPVYGIKKSQSSIFAHIESGEAIATVCADVSGRNDHRNKVYAAFKLREQKSELVFLDYTSTGGGTVYANHVQPGELSGEITVRYTVLNGSDKGYSEMAALFRNRLIEKGVLKSKNDNKVPLLLEIVGAVDVVEPVLGIPQGKIVRLTSYKEAREIADYYLDNQVDRLGIKYLGAIKGGIRHDSIYNVKHEPRLGSAKELSELSDFLNQNGADLFIDASFCYIAKNKINDDFILSRDTTRFLNNKRGRIFDSDMPTFYYSLNTRHIIKPSLVPEYSGKFSASLKKYNAGLSVRDIGNSLISDFNVKDPVFRDMTQQYYSEAFDKANKNGQKILVNGANMYVLPYTQFICGMPSRSNIFDIADESVPFYQMVVHGYADYVYTPINLSYDIENDVLRIIETGAGVYSTLLYNEAFVLKESAYSQYYSSGFESQKKRVLELYQKISDALRPVYGNEMVKHYKLVDDVYVTEYSNGSAMVVNYSDREYTNGNIRVSARGYKLVGGDDL